MSLPSVRALLRYIHNTTKKCYCLGFVIILSACSAINIETYQANTPKLDISEFFRGNLKASGIVKNRSGKVIRYFNADIEAVWLENEKLQLDEHFTFNDGEKQRRTWVLEKLADGSYLASANDVIGKWPVKTSGNAMFLNYILQIPYKGKTLNVKVDDRMYLTHPNTLINESQLSKFGISVGSITLYIHKVSD